MMTATLVMVFAPVAGLGVPCCCRCPWRPQCLSPLGHRSLQSNLVFTPFQSVPLLPRPKTQDAPLSLEAGGYGQTRVTCFVARRLKVVAVAGLLWISWCVLGSAAFFLRYLFLILFFFERARSAAAIRPPCLIYLFTSIIACPLRQLQQAIETV